MNAFTGLRREEIEQLDWSEVKFDRGLIDLPGSKSKNKNRKLEYIATTNAKGQPVDGVSDNLLINSFNVKPVGECNRNSW